MKPWDDIPSIWQNWQKQCFNKSFDNHGATCAIGFVRFPYDPSHIVAFAGDIYQHCRRVAAYIRAHYKVPVRYLHPVDKLFLFPQNDNGHCIIYANNVLKLTPEQFREIDRLTQWEEAQAQLARQIEGIEREEAVGV